MNDWGTTISILMQKKLCVKIGQGCVDFDKGAQNLTWGA